MISVRSFFARSRLPVTSSVYGPDADSVFTWTTPIFMMSPWDSVASAAVEGGVALLEERGCPLVEIVGLDERCEQRRFQPMRVEDAHLHPQRDRAFGCGHRQRSVGGNPCRQGSRRLHHGALRDDLVDEADRQCLGCRDALARVHHPLRPADTTEPGEVLRAARTGDETERDLRLAEDCRFIGD